MTTGRAVRVAVAALLAVAAAAVGASPATAAGRPGGPGWVSGAFLPGHSAADYEAFGTWRGQPLDVAVDATARGTWQDTTSPQWLLGKWSRSSAPLVVLSVAMLPDDPSATMATCASGEDDEHWAELGRSVTAAGLADRLVVRLGWEMNGDWQKWSATDPDAFVACWRRAHDAVEAQAPAVRWDWSVNRGEGQGLADARRAYPGDAYVDVVGVDSYDVFPAVVDEATWAEQLDGPYGLRFWAGFARDHGKAFAVPEWGLYPGPGNTGPNGGDNPLYVEKMQGFFREVSGQLAYEAYFNEDAGYNAGSLWGPAQNPRAAQAYAAGLR
ncbi:glycosyl hydrolase [Quadrisphaera sp. INWT6]|uniref:glycoside hydrolase family 26 protein n=1 Tax=Quadrisphaera sp. INWT6 TaxID=2596917 RepID=UPI0018926F06|nr:glycosyl hydrolase [Quadrisphaera sp. INWT6]MBF5080379.1 glycosidase [Quadrisphaera sp. INWT6]